MLDPSTALAATGVLGFLATAVILAVSFLTPWPRRRRSSFLRPVDVYSPSAGDSRSVFPSILKEDPNERPPYTKPELYLSVIIPAMNEEERLPIMLAEAFEYLEDRSNREKSFTYEIIVVDDGSRDRTADVAFSFGEKYTDHLKVVKLEANRGKGGAVRVGVLHSRGSMILFVDADGATKFSDLSSVEEELVKLTVGSTSGKYDYTFPAVSVGSRAHLEKESTAKRSLARTILMVGFHVLVRGFAVATIRDTQCGFKLFTRAAAARLFPVLHIERWAFDVELLYLCEKWRIPIAEVAVTWHEVDGSKVTPIWSWLQMGRDLFLIWFRYSSGIWKDKSSE